MHDIVTLDWKIKSTQWYLTFSTDLLHSIINQYLLKNKGDYLLEMSECRAYLWHRCSKQNCGLIVVIVLLFILNFCLQFASHYYWLDHYRWKNFEIYNKSRFLHTWPLHVNISPDSTTASQGPHRTWTQVKISTELHHHKSRSLLDVITTNQDLY